MNRGPGSLSLSHTYRERMCVRHETSLSETPVRHRETETPSTRGERMTEQTECTGCKATAGSCEVKRWLSGRRCCAECSHRRDEATKMPVFFQRGRPGDLQ